MNTFKRDPAKPVCVSINIMGGLGNQLFQIFTAIAYGIENRRKIIFPYELIAATRPTYWSSFLQHLHFLTTDFQQNQYTNAMLRSFPVFSEEGFEYSKIPSIGENHLFLSGYFQSYKYFNAHLPHILKLMRFHEIRAQVLDDFPLYTASDPCLKISMHFRQGDYKNLAEYHNIVPYEYYETALARLLLESESESDSKSKKQVLYFCEQEDLPAIEQIIARLNVRFEDKALQFIRVGDEASDWQQMVLMTSCNAHIIANSTFSWWGAFLASSKQVYYPSKWFGDKLSYHNTVDLFPEHWNKIETN